MKGAPATPGMRKILSLTGKHFLTGVSGHDYVGYGGLFRKAYGVSAIRSIGNFDVSPSLGLLQAGPSGGSGGSSVIVDTPIAGARNAESASNSYLYVLGSGGHLYKKDNSNGAPTDIGGSLIPNPSNGIGIFQPAAGTKYLYVFRQTIIDRVSVASAPSAYPTGWTQSWQTGLQSTNNHPVHNFNTALWFGNDFYIGKIQDDGAGAETYSAIALSLPKQYQVTALEDDGYYLIAAISSDKSSLSSVVSSKIIFWDTLTTNSWTREFPIDDTIVAMKRVGNVIYALGGRGIYELSFSGGVRKVFAKGTTVVNSGSNRLIGPGMLSSFNGALVIADDNGLGLFGRPAPGLPIAYHIPFVTDSGIAPSFIDAEFQNGNIIIGDASTAMKLYPMIYTANQQATGVNAESVYIPLDQPYQIDRLDITFGRVFASGDSLTFKVRKNDGVNDATFGLNDGAITFANHGAIRRVVATTSVKPVVEDFKFTAVFNGGVVAIRKFDVWGTPQTPKTR